MQVNLPLLYATVIAILLVVVLFNLVCKHVLFTRLRRDHPRLWEELGEPSLFRARSWRETMERPRVIWTIKVADLPESTTVKLVVLARISDVMGGVLFILLMAVFTFMHLDA